jgi:hypothetical protein
MPSADQVSVKSTHSRMRWHMAICLSEIMGILQKLGSFWCAPKARVTSGGLMGGNGKRIGALQSTATAPVLDSTQDEIMIR